MIAFDKLSIGLTSWEDDAGSGDDLIRERGKGFFSFYVYICVCVWLLRRAVNHFYFSSLRDYCIAVEFINSIHLIFISFGSYFMV